MHRARRIRATFSSKQDLLPLMVRTSGRAARYGVLGVGHNVAVQALPRRGDRKTVCREVAGRSPRLNSSTSLGVDALEYEKFALASCDD